MNYFKLIYKILPVFCISMLLLTCEDPIAFERGKKADLLVIDGKVNASDTVQTVLLTHTDVVGRSARFPPEVGATVILIENESQRYDYVEIEPGIYKLFNFTPKVGNTYRIDIELSDKNHYTSQPEIVPQPVPIDSAYVIYDGNLKLFTQVAIPTDDDGPYLRWRIRHVYQHTDQYCGFPDNITTCYYELNRATDNQLVLLLDGSELARGAVVQAPIIATPAIDSIFGEITFYTIYQEALTLSTFRYWEQVNRLLAQTGSIFDAPPGQIRGNIINVDNPNELVLGLFYATYEAIAYVKTFPADFAPLQLSSYCGIPGIFSNPFPEDCCVCRPGIPRPDYWK